MTDSEPLLPICDAVVKAINGADLSPQQVEASLSFQEIDTPLEDLEGQTMVEVAFPDPPKVQFFDRGRSRYDVLITVGLRHKFGAAEQQPLRAAIAPDEIRAMLNLQARIRAALIGIRELPCEGFGTAVELVPPTVTSEFNRKHLRELRQFTGIIKYQFSIIVQE